MGPTEALARFAVEVDTAALSPAVRTAARRAMLDTLGVALAGTSEPVTRLVGEQVRRQGAVAECLLWGGGGRSTAQNAALVNGVAAHALDFDDTNHTMRGRPSAAVLPAVIALGERQGASGAELLAAYVIAVELECKLGSLTGDLSYERGW